MRFLFYGEPYFENYCLQLEHQIKILAYINKLIKSLLNNVIAHIFLHAIISRVRVIIAFFIRLKACYSMPTYCT
jgi:hypothetical protein